DEDRGVELGVELERAQVGAAQVEREPRVAGEDAGVAEDRRAGVDPDDVPAEAGEADRVEPGAAGGVEESPRRGGEEPGQPGDMALDGGEAAAGSVVALVEVLAEQPAVHHRVAPVELDGGVEGDGERRDRGWTQPSHGRGG